MAEPTVDINAGVLAPVADEIDVVDLPVTGRLPTELDGVLVRNGPNPFSGRFEAVAGADPMLTWWVAPAMVHGVALGDGRARWYRNRWVRTDGWHHHHGSGPAATGDQGGAETNPNVNVIRHHGATLALAEGALPVEIDDRLATVGPTDLGGALVGGSGRGGMTAHPKIEPVSGELRYIRADWQAPYLRYGVLDRTGRPVVDQVIDVDEPAMMHDVAITATRTLFLDLNVAYDFELLHHGQPIPLRWRDDRPARIGVIDRAGGTVRWIEIAPCFVQHVINAHDVGDDTVVLDVVRYRSFLRFDRDAGGYAPNPLGVPWRYTIRLGERPSVAETPLDDRHVELPRIDDRRTGRANRFAYAVEQPTDTEMRGVIAYDLVDGGATRFAVPPGDQNSEPVFVPRTAEGAEGDGWLLVAVYRAATDTTDVVVLDAAAIDAGPVATVHLPRRIPAGFHGAWLATV